MTKEQAQQMLDELNEARLDKPFEGNAKSLFEAIMKIADERDELKKKVKARNIGINSLMQSRKKWKNRYYKIRKQLKQKYDRDTHILQNQLDLANAKNIEKDKIIDLMANHIATSDSDLCEYLDITTKCKYYAGDNGKTCDNCIKQYFENKAKELLNK